MRVYFLYLLLYTPIVGLFNLINYYFNLFYLLLFCLLHIPAICCLIIFEHFLPLLSYAKCPRGFVSLSSISVLWITQTPIKHKDLNNIREEIELYFTVECNLGFQWRRLSSIVRNWDNRQRTKRKHVVLVISTRQKNSPVSNLVELVERVSVWKEM